VNNFRRATSHFPAVAVVTVVASLTLNPEWRLSTRVPPQANHPPESCRDPELWALAPFSLDRDDFTIAPLTVSLLRA
jgi:hypothetical protein